MDNTTSTDQLITHVQDPAPADSVPAPSPAPVQQVISEPLVSTSTPAQANPVAPANPSTSAPTAVPDVVGLRQKLLEDMRLSVRDISQKVVEMQLPLRETIAKVQEKMSQGITLPTTHYQPSQDVQPPPAVPIAAEPQVPESAVTPQEAVEEAMPTLSSQPEPMVSEPELQAIPSVVEAPVQVVSEPIQQTPPEVTVPSEAQDANYTQALNTLSETGINLLRGIVELDQKQPGPEPSAPLSNRKVITDKDLVEFLLDDKNNPNLKDFGDLKVVRKIMREHLGLPSEEGAIEPVIAAVEESPVDAVPDSSLQASVETGMSSMPSVPDTATDTSSVPVVNDPQPTISEAPTLAQTPLPPLPEIDPKQEATPPQAVPSPVPQAAQPQATAPASADKGSIKGFFNKLFKRS